VLANEWVGVLVLVLGVELGWEWATRLAQTLEGQWEEVKVTRLGAHLEQAKGMEWGQVWALVLAKVLGTTLGQTWEQMLGRV
jgi:hypothetical protein